MIDSLPDSRPGLPERLEKPGEGAEYLRDRNEWKKAFEDRLTREAPSLRTDGGTRAAPVIREAFSGK